MEKRGGKGKIGAGERELEGRKARDEGERGRKWRGGEGLGIMMSNGRGGVRIGGRERISKEGKREEQGTGNGVRMER